MTRRETTTYREASHRSTHQTPTNQPLSRIVVQEESRHGDMSYWMTDRKELELTSGAMNSGVPQNVDVVSP